MKNKQLVHLLLALAVCPLGMILKADEAPQISPSEDQMVLIDDSDGGSTLDFTASGGKCDQPTSDPDAGGTGNGDCAWTEDGDMYYVWEYTDTEDDPDNGLSGDPGSDDDPGSADGGDQSTLSIDESQGGSSSITVYAVQNWIASDGSGNTTSTYSSGRTLRINAPHTNDDGGQGPTPTQSSKSNPVNATIQIPTSLKFVKGSIAGSSGASFVFKVLDQNGNPIKNATLTMNESLTVTYVDTDTNGKVLNTRSGGGPGVAFSSTDGDGNGTDVPVGAKPQDLINALAKYKCSYTTVTTVDHTYSTIVLAGGKTYDIEFDQTQTITQQVTYNPPSTPGGQATGNVSTIAVSPTSP